MRDSLLFSLPLSLFLSLRRKQGNLAETESSEVLFEEGRHGWILKYHRALEPPCRIFNPPSDLSARVLGKKLIFPIWLNFCVAFITRCRMREDDFSSRPRFFSRLIVALVLNFKGWRGALRAVKKEFVAKFRISWRGGTDVAIHSLSLVFRRSSHKC